MQRTPEPEEDDHRRDPSPARRVLTEEAAAAASFWMVWFHGGIKIRASRWFDHGGILLHCRESGFLCVGMWLLRSFLGGLVFTGAVAGFGFG